MVMGHIVENASFFLKKSEQSSCNSNSIVIFTDAEVTGCVQCLFIGFFPDTFLFV